VRSKSAGTLMAKAEPASYLDAAGVLGCLV
jgi:hypothetical protein